MKINLKRGEKMIKNYTTKISAAQTVGEIQEILATHGAKRIMMEYGEKGRVASVTFALECFGALHAFRLEPKSSGVKAVLTKERIKCDDSQAERIAWRNIKDWIAAQIALVEAEQATMEELFLPQLVGEDDTTVYDVFATGKSKLLQSDNSG